MSRPRSIDYASVVALREAGWSGPKLAHLLGTTTNVIYRACEVGDQPHRHGGGATRRHHPELIRRVVALKGVRSASQIAVAAGVSKNTVIGIWRRHA